MPGRSELRSFSVCYALSQESVSTRLPGIAAAVRACKVLLIEFDRLFSLFALLPFGSHGVRFHACLLASTSLCVGSSVRHPVVLEGNEDGCESADRGKCRRPWFLPSSGAYTDFLTGLVAMESQRHHFCTS